MIGAKHGNFQFSAEARPYVWCLPYLLSFGAHVEEAADTCCSTSDTLPFGYVYTGATAEDSFFIANCGDVALEDSIDWLGLLAVFTPLSDSAYNIAPGETMWFSLEFDPAAVTSYADTNLLGHDSCGSIILTGTGIGSFSTGVMNPTAAIELAFTPQDDNGWNGETRIYASDNSYASITAPTFDAGNYSRLLIAQDFSGVSALDDTDIIDGIIVTVERSVAVSSSGQDTYIRLYNGTSLIGSALFSGTNWGLIPNFDQVAILGSSTSKWGTSGLTGADVKALGFGVAYGMQARIGYNDVDVFVDHITMRLYYHAAP